MILYRECGVFEYIFMMDDKIILTLRSSYVPDLILSAYFRISILKYFNYSHFNAHRLHERIARVIAAEKFYIVLIIRIF